MAKDDYELVRSILGNEVYKNKRTKKCYLIRWTKKGNPKWVKLKNCSKKK